MISDKSFYLDWLIFLISIILLIGYHLFLAIKANKIPGYTIQSTSVIARRAWVKSVMAHNKDILAVQTLRNSIMAASFLASTAVLLIIGTLTLSGIGDKLSPASQITDFSMLPNGFLFIKLLLLVLVFFVAFLNFCFAIRVFNHVGYMINLSPETRKEFDVHQDVANYLNKGWRYYSIGMRAYYFSVPIIFWLFGPYLMLLASIILVITLFQVDRVPRS